MEIGRPLWLALFISYWTLYLPHRVGMGSAWLLGVAATCFMARCSARMRWC